MNYSILFAGSLAVASLLLPAIGQACDEEVFIIATQSEVAPAAAPQPDDNLSAADPCGAE